MSETLKKCYVVIYFLYSHQWTPYLVSYSTICLVSPRIKGSKCHYIWQKQQPITKLLVLILLLSYFEHVIISFDIWNFHEFWGRIFIRYSNDGESWDYHLQNIFVELFLPRYQIINLHSCLFLNFIVNAVDCDMSLGNSKQMLRDCSMGKSCHYLFKTCH